MAAGLPSALILVTLSGVPPAALAQPAKAKDGQYPNKPVRLIVPFSPGGTNDVMARMVAQHLSQTWGESFIVDNRAGGEGLIGTEIAVKARPDGYTLLLVSSAYVMNPAVRKMPYDSVKAMDFVAKLGATFTVLSTGPSLPVTSVKDLLAAAKARPGELNYGSTGIGSGSHLSTELFMARTGIRMTHIPYRGTAPAVQDVIAGQVELMFAPLVNTQAHIRSGRLKALGVTSAQRLAAFPQVPAIAEVLPGYETHAWFGLFGPAGMDPALVRRLSDAARQSIATASVRQRIEFDGATAVGNSAEDFGRFVQAEIQRWAKVVRYSGAKPE